MSESDRTTNGALPPSEQPETTAPPEPRDLSEQLGLKAWAAQRWADLVEAVAEAEAVEKGLEIAKRRRGPTIRVAPGEVTAMVPDPPRSRKTVAFECPVIEHEHWERVANRAAVDPILSSTIIAGDLPADLQTLAASADLHLVPAASDLTPKRGRATLEWDENVAGAAIAFAKRLEDEPGLLLTFRGMTPEAFRELVRQRAALASSGGKGASAYAQRPPIGPDQEPPALELLLDTFWSAGPELQSIETPISAPDHPHSLLRRLGASPLSESSSFPLIGLLATCYDLMTEAEVRRGAANPDSVFDGEPEGD